MKAKFRIRRLGAQIARSIPFDEIITKEILDDISLKLISTDQYEVEWINERNIGRTIELECDGHLYFINLSQFGEIVARNNYFQSVITAYGNYLILPESVLSNSSFYFYFLPFSGNNQTPYMMFMYRILSTVGIKFINLSFGLGVSQILPFNSIREIIKERNTNRAYNAGNKSTYITDEGEEYHVYGKTFGANQKETTLLCIAIASLADKPVKLYQIIDNDSNSLSKQDIDTINRYVTINSTKSLKVMDDTMEFDDGDTDVIVDKLRSPKFIYNLLGKYEGVKKCVLCNCKIESIVQAAHILPVSQIRKNGSLSDEEKFNLATDKDNGIWLCQNHHKLFDGNMIWFEEGVIKINKLIETDNLNFIEKITENSEIEKRYVNDRMLAFFDMRAGIPPRMAL